MVAHLWLIDVQDRDVAGDVVTRIKNALLAAMNSPEAFMLAIVRVQFRSAYQSVYGSLFFQRGPRFTETGVDFKVSGRLSVGGALR